MDKVFFFNYRQDKDNIHASKEIIHRSVKYVATMTSYLFLKIISHFIYTRLLFKFLFKYCCTRQLFALNEDLK